MKNLILSVSFLLVSISVNATNKVPNVELSKIVYIQNGATHYKEFALNECWNESKDDFKTWLVCPIDNLRYYY